MGQRRPQQEQPRIAIPSGEDLQTIIQGNDIDSAKLTVQWGQQLGRDLKQLELKTAQIRTIFGHVRQIEMNWTPGDVERAHEAERQLILLKPKLAYQAQRDAEKNKRTQPVRRLEEVLSPAIDLVQGNRDYFQRFVDFFEAILAYHKAEGGN